MKLIFAYRKKVASDTYTNYFIRPSKFDYLPGQFVEIQLPHTADERGEQRWFTLSSSPSLPELSITTRHVADHPSSFKNAFFELKKGGSLECKGPMGSFVLPENLNTPLVWIAGGIGVTPFMSQMRYMIDNKQNRKITMIHGNRTLPDNPCRDLVEEFALKNPHFQYIEILSETPPSNWMGEIGTIDKPKLQRLVSIIDQTVVFVSGPEAMVEALEPIILSLGVAKDQLHQDWFPGYNEKY